ncbi:MAG TPA: peptidoglycan-binding domain-containing protein [Streptosporangiaceae bacterium]
MTSVGAPGRTDPGGRTRTRKPRRWRLITAVALVVVVAGGGVAAGWPRISRMWAPEPVADRTYSGGPTSTATVARHDLTAREQVDGLLGYSGAYTVLATSRGTLTWVPEIGKVIREGGTAYRVDGDPVKLLYGHTPAYRDLADGVSGPDVEELNRALVALDYASDAQIDPSSDYYGAATADAVQRLQDDMGVTEDGVLHLGQAVFLPTAVRVTAVPGTAGGAANGPVLKGTSTTREVTIDLDAAEQSEVKKGDKVAITMPNNDTTPGRVTKVGTVATSPSSSPDSGASPSPTIEVEITPDHPKATGHVDQGPVQVEITTNRVKDALVVPVTALLATTGGGYAVETVDASKRHTLVPVSTGVFDDSAGLVQVTGTDLRAGQTIVVAAS